MNTRRFSRATLSIVAVLLFVLLGTGCQLLSLSQPIEVLPAPAAPGPALALAPAATSVPLSDFSLAIREVAQKVKPAVVQITNEQTQVDFFTQQPFTAVSSSAGMEEGIPAVVMELTNTNLLTPFSARPSVISSTRLIFLCEAAREIFFISPTW